MRRGRGVWLPASLILGAVLVLGTAVAPVEVRHSAPYGFSQTVDFDRQPAIAVTGGYVRANYPDFNRLDLDLRAYTPGAVYDLTVHVRPAEVGAPDARTIRLRLTADEIFHVKEPFANPFLTLRFPPLPDSAGRTYYVWVERGPRNRDDVIALWSVKSYSRVRGYEVVRAWLRHASAARSVQIALIGAVGVFALSAGWLLATATRTAAGRPEVRRMAR